MDRAASKILAAAVILFLAASSALGEAPRKPSSGKQPSRNAGKEVHRLDEVRILGSVEHPGVLFFLPRAKFRLQPVREAHDWKERILRTDRDKEEIPE